jgi:hypothetical protein
VFFYVLCFFDLPILREISAFAPFLGGGVLKVEIKRSPERHWSKPELDYHVSSFIEYVVGATA